VRVDGASGDWASVVNGVFALEEELYNGRALYRKVGDPHCWLRFAPDSTWVISDTVAKDANNNDGHAYLLSFGLSLPIDLSVWKVTVNGKWVEQAAMRVQPASEQEKQAAERKANEDAKRHAAVCIFAVSLASPTVFRCVSISLTNTCYKDAKRHAAVCIFAVILPVS